MTRQPGGETPEDRQDAPESLAEFLPPGREPGAGAGPPPVRLFEGTLPEPRTTDVESAADVPSPAPGPDGVPLEPDGAMVGPDGASPEPGGGAAPEGPAGIDSRRPGRRSRAALPVLASLLVGALLSGLGVYSWQRTDAEAAERNRIVLAARVTSVEVRGAGDWPVTVLLDNLGRSPLRVEGAQLAGGNLFNSAIRQVSRGTSIEPGKPVPIGLDVSLDCSGGGREGGAQAPGALILTLAAPEGRTRTVRVPLADDDGDLAVAAKSGCRGSTTLNVEANLSRRSSPVTSGRILTTLIDLQFSTDPPGGLRRRWSSRVVTLRSAVPGLGLTVSPTPVLVPSASPSRTGSSRSTGLTSLAIEVTLRWRVSECRLVGRLEADVWVMAEVGDPATTGTFTTALHLGNDVLLAVSRFVGTTCGAGT